jgi:hypothetical protein
VRAGGAHAGAAGGQGGGAGRGGEGRVLCEFCQPALPAPCSLALLLSTPRPPAAQLPHPVLLLAPPQVCLSQLPATLVALRTAQQERFAAGARSMAQLVKWLMLCLGKLWKDVPGITAMAMRDLVRPLAPVFFCLLPPAVFLPRPSPLLPSWRRFWQSASGAALSLNLLLVLHKFCQSLLRQNHLACLNAAPCCLVSLLCNEGTVSEEPFPLLPPTGSGEAGQVAGRGQPRDPSSSCLCAGGAHTGWPLGWFRVCCHLGWYCLVFLLDKPAWAAGCGCRRAGRVESLGASRGRSGARDETVEGAVALLVDGRSMFGFVATHQGML